MVITETVVPRISGLDQSSGGREYLEPYLDARRVRPEDLTSEKRFFLTFLGNLFKELPFRPGQSIAILGTGPGLECLKAAELLPMRKDGGRDISIISLDINPAVLRALRERTSDPRILNGLTTGDIRSLPNPPFTDNFCGLVIVSSVLHDVASRHGWKGITEAVREAGRITAPGGCIFFREFRPPLAGEQIIRFKTLLARNFFLAFDNYFPVGFEKRKDPSWGWIKEEETLWITNQFAFEVLLHFRVYLRDLKRLPAGVNFRAFQRWQGMRERFALKIPHEEDSSEVLLDNISRILAGEWKGPDAMYTNYSSFSFTVPDMDDITTLEEHFEWQSALTPDPLCRLQFARFYQILFKHNPYTEEHDVKVREDLLRQQAIDTMNLVTKIYAQTPRE